MINPRDCKQGLPMRFLSLPLLPLVLAACSPDLDLTPPGSQAVPLYDQSPERTDLDRLSYLGGVTLTNPDERFGGFSALTLSPDGSRLLAVSDSAYWMTANIGWNETDGSLSVGAFSISPILSRSGDPLDGRAADSEAIADLGGGVHAVSFEREHRINTYALGEDWSRLDSVGEAFPAPPGADDFVDNGGMEGLTSLPDGALLAGIEGGSDGVHPLWLHRDGSWARSELAAAPDYGLTALDYHDGHVYALERFWQSGIGNRIRILRFPAAALDTGGRIEPDLLGTLEAGKAVDNFEGLAITERGDHTVLLVMSDDNYSRSQRTLLLAFQLD
ncbi:esterase-like activity of phytase family protein [Maricaulis sp.]|uniref:esterase-like activity of phytase family protein n=1 Tax=Maricaulis sp. TaxID=1486257 RepID=UPI0025C45B14|nr:esterase-like activity of phytase family protein [Maricaulis sp.]